MSSAPPDYGEPWTPAFRNSARTSSGYDHDFMDDFQKRAIECVNACQGMADPAKEIMQMKEALKEAHAALDQCREDTCELIAERDWWKNEPRCGYSARRAPYDSSI